MENIFLGIDTSCYTTSAAAITETGALMGERRQLLTVKPGRCGLQQSEMVFQHTRNLPRLLEELLAGGDYRIAAIGVSARPRPLADSYMPAFLPGLAAARSLAVALKAPLYQLSHQENHLEAGLWSAGLPEEQARRFLLLHASGGTTDLLLCRRRQDGRYDIEQLGGSLDLHAGQFVDRIGVALGLKFPAGAALERLAQTADPSSMPELPVAVRRFDASLSGPATAAERCLQKGADPAALALGVQHVLAETFARMLRRAAEDFSVDDVLLVGGVGSNNYIRGHVQSKLAKRRVRLWVPEGRFSCDNAAGCAALARRLKLMGQAAENDG